ncbi:MAG: glycerol-3-phosphate dehydrogenase [Micavibrio sp. TMED27]|nr:MAG: glycerol-3-phosphate dehydrogenase [Micavibrio sp. TMED27]
MINEEYDLCVIGGGINGVGIARDAAGRGLSVLLVEAKDLAQATSSSSSKLIHGGLRYLEFFEFGLVRSSLIEREKLLAIAPHIIWPLEFVLPYKEEGAKRPYWLVRLGLFLYDHLARRTRIASSSAVEMDQALMRSEYKRGFVYSDCWVDDSRLVVLNALDAKERGAQIKTHTRCEKIAEGHDEYERFKVTLKDQKTGKLYKIGASMVVNAAGPWVGELLEDSGLDDATPIVRHVKGSHIIVPRKFEGDRAYTLTPDDGRVVFVIPYENDYTLIGTTEQDYEGDLYDVQISDDEIDYLCSVYSSYFKKTIHKQDVLWAYSGVRPLCDDGKSDARKVSRDYVIFDHRPDFGKMISVFGGKLTTYRVLAEKVVNKLLHLDSRYVNPWTDQENLPGGDFPEGHFAVFFAEVKRNYSWLDDTLLYRYARSYGTRMDVFLDGALSEKDLGRKYADGLYEAELAYLIRYEFVRSLEDALFRRSKIGLHISESVYEELQKAWPKIVERAGGYGT